MCSSMKRSREVKKLQLNFEDDLSNEQRLRFAAKANIARARRDALNKNSADKHIAKSRFFNLFRWFKQYLP